MKNIVLVIVCLLFIRNKCFGQDKPLVYRAFSYAIDIYDKITQKYENGISKNVDILIFLTVDKIQIMDDGHDEFYIKQSMPVENKNGLTIYPFICYDKTETECIVAFSYNEKGKYLVITYAKDFKISYNLRLISDGK